MDITGKSTTEITVYRYTAYKRSVCELLDDTLLTPGLRVGYKDEDRMLLGGS